MWVTKLLSTERNYPTRHALLLRNVTALLHLGHGIDLSLGLSTLHIFSQSQFRVLLQVLRRGSPKVRKLINILLPVPTVAYGRQSYSQQVKNPSPSNCMYVRACVLTRFTEKRHVRHRSWEISST